MIFGVKIAAVALSILLLIPGTGCQTNDKARRPLPAGVNASDIAALHLITVPVGLNLDNRPGLDGISLKVYASDWQNPKPVSIHEGILKIEMFDGRFNTNALPLRVWTYQAAELKAREFRARIGTGYEFLLPWGESKPKSRVITVRALYNSPSGRTLRSAASAITVEDMPKK